MVGLLMFGLDEYRYFTAELGKVARDLETARERLQVLRSEMADDGVGHEPYVCVQNAVHGIGLIEATLDSASAALPVPTRERT